MGFLPNGYTPQESDTSSKYLRIKQGDNLIRILSKPIIGYMAWKDKSPVRVKNIKESKKHQNMDGNFREFWALVVYSYDNQCICIWEFTQKTILKAIANLVNDKAWGSPLGYDLKITRTGEDMNTEYNVNPYPHKDVPKEIADMYSSTPITLNALYEGEDPFDADNANDLPF